MPIYLGILGLPRLTADLVAAAFSPDDGVHLEMLVGESAVRLRDSPGKPRHDVVIAGVDDPWQAGVRRLLTQRPDLVLIAFRREGRDAWIYELRPRPHSLGQLGPALLRQVVLAAVHPTGIDLAE